ncbi:hypothetical protein B9Z55_026408 [Caenorhabditis nigoni]|uniref:Rad50/SbcC-type AAA domain-containing protein n=1 Tax=Caenorhabditis nigoni TaxID=1611254 RepID=A0A2G5T359_9PELO|nr:hypothetical protein B9Z55_026408 [Caenorhabditis nigoni]
MPYLHSINVVNFRDFRNRTFRFASGLNVIHGANSSGKSSLIAALQFGLTGSDPDAHGNVVLQFQDGETVVDLGRMKRRNGGEEYEIDGEPVEKREYEEELLRMGIKADHLSIMIHTGLRWENVDHTPAKVSKCIEKLDPRGGEIATQMNTVRRQLGNLPRSSRQAKELNDKLEELIQERNVLFDTRTLPNFNRKMQGFYGILVGDPLQAVALRPVGRRTGLLGVELNINHGPRGRGFVSEMSKTEKTKAAMSYSMALCEANNSRLVVFDDVDEVDPNAFQRYIDGLVGCATHLQIIVTSRHSGFANMAPHRIVL